MSKMIRVSDIKGDTPYDIILRAWLSHKIEELPQIQQDMLDRWKMVDKLIKQGEIVLDSSGDVIQNTQFNFQNLVEWLVQRYKISVRTAYDDIKNAKRFFLSCEGREDIEYARGHMIEVGMKVMHECIERGKYKEAAAFYKELNKIKGLHDRAIDLPDYADFVPPHMVLITDPTELGFEKIDNVEDVIKRIMSDKRQGFLDNEAVDAEVEE